MSTPAQVPDLAAQVAILAAQVDALTKIVTDGFIEGGKEDQIPLVLRPASKVPARPGLRLLKPVRTCACGRMTSGGPCPRCGGAR